MQPTVRHELQNVLKFKVLVESLKNSAVLNLKLEWTQKDHQIQLTVSQRTTYN